MADTGSPTASETAAAAAAAAAQNKTEEEIARDAAAAAQSAKAKSDPDKGHQSPPSSPRGNGTPTGTARGPEKQSDGRYKPSGREEDDHWRTGYASSNEDSDDSEDGDYEKRIRRLKSKVEKLSKLRPKEPTKYDGSSKYSELENWMQGVETYLETKGMIDDKRAIPFVSTLLTGAAATWWRYHLISVRNGTSRKMENWEEFRESILAHFRPEDAKRLAREKLQKCTQTGSVRDFNQRYQRLMVEIPEMHEKDRVYQYITGLKPAVRLQVEWHYPKTLKNAMEFAELADSTLYMSQHGSKPRPNNGFYNSNSNRGGQQNRPRPNNSNRSAWTGRRVNVMDNHATGNGAKETRTCYHCGKAGHLKSDCRKYAADLKNGTVVEPDKKKNGAAKDNSKKKPLN